MRFPTNRMLLFIISLSLLISTVYSVDILAFDAPWDSGHNTTGLGGTPPVIPPENPSQPKGGEPVILSTGDFVYDYQDFFIPGRIPLEIKRTYHSQDKYNGPLGYGWHFNYNIALIETTDEHSHYLTIRMGDGTRIQFVENGSGSFIAPPGRFLSLTRNGSSYKLQEKDGLEYNFDSEGVLTSIVDRNGNQLTMGYDSSRRLSSVTDDAGRALSFAYGSNNKIQAITDPAGRVVWYRYDGKSNLIEVTNPAGNKIAYAYDSNHNLISITDARNHIYLVNIYDNQDRVVSQFDNGGIYTFSYDTTNLTTTVTNPNGIVTKYYLNGTGNPVTIVRDAEGLNSTYVITYDSDMNILSVTDPNGNTISYTYDSMGNVLSVTEPNGNVNTFTYDPIHNRVTTCSDPITLEYDSKGNLTKTVDALGFETVHTYAPNGDRLSILDAGGGLTQFAYDSYGNIISGTDALGNSYRCSYDILGNRTSRIDKRGNITTFSYDQLNRPSKVTDAVGNITTFTYDQNENQTANIDAQHRVTSFTYDNYNQIETITDALGNTTSFVYDLHGNTLSINDAEGNTITYEYDSLDRLTKLTNALNQTTMYSYDLNGNPVTVKDAKGNITTYIYSSLNRLTQITYPDGLTKTYTYDLAGNRISESLRNGNTVHYAYDGLNRLISKIYPDSTVETYAYDEMSRLVVAANSHSTINSSYDALDRVIQVNQDGRIVSYEYDEVGRRTKLVYPDGSYVRYSYDSLNRLDHMRNAANEVIAQKTYDSMQRNVRLDLLNGIKTTYEYDPANRLLNSVAKTSPSDTIISRFNYAYDKLRNKTSMTAMGGTHTYLYDKIYQLTRADHPDGHGFPGMTYNYDAGGNRTSTTNVGTVTYTTNTMNQYTNVGGKSFSYDANGNLVSDGTSTYEYDYQNRLVRATTPTASISYAYDPMGRRISKTVNGVTTRFIYDGKQVIEEVDGDGKTMHYVYGAGIDETLSMIKADTGTRYYYHRDYLGSVTEVSDGSGNAIERYEYSAYGEPKIKDPSGNILSVSAIGNPYMFASGRWDPETGLYYLRARMYSPALGRFLQIDPLWSVYQHMNLYVYVGNNPVLRSDPGGLLAGDKFSTMDGAAIAALMEINSTSVFEGREYGGWVYPNDDGTYSYTWPEVGEAASCRLPAKPSDAVAMYHTHGFPDPGYRDWEFSDTDINAASRNNVSSYLATPYDNILKNNVNSSNKNGDYQFGPDYGRDKPGVVRLPGIVLTPGLGTGGSKERRPSLRPRPGVKGK